MNIEVACSVFPTENQYLVEKALTNLFGGVSLQREQKETITVLRTAADDREGIIWLRDRIHDLRIIDVARKLLIENWDEEQTYILFDKQAASQGRVRIVDDSDQDPPLGCVHTTLRFDSVKEFEDFLSWFAPMTQDGRIIAD
ncbi:MAG: hypothetical protein JSW61_00240 [Candidatus Thorarchaeota archaeon]|nr:MAG: hypothetical protein JSW61_00240 [Candidatus Thorarchaeota archaeon]